VFDLNTEADTPFSDIFVEKPKPKKEGKVRQGNDKYACTAIAWNAKATNSLLLSVIM